MKRTVGSDVLVLVIAADQQLSIDELWVGFDSGKSFRYLHVPTHEMARALGPESVYPCPSYTLSVDVTVSSFTGRGKMTVWDIWKTFSDVTPVFFTLASTPSSVYDQLDVIERSVVLLYTTVPVGRSLGEGERGKESIVSTERQTYGWLSTNSSCSGGTHTHRAAYTKQFMFGHRCS